MSQCYKNIVIFVSSIVSSIIYGVLVLTFALHICCKTFKMDENLINFWKNYENIINWGYRMSGAQGPDGSGSTAPIINIQTRVGL